MIRCPKCGNQIQIDDAAPSNTCNYCGVVLKKRAPAPAPVPAPAAATVKADDIGETGSYFDGKLIQMIGLYLLSGLLVAITFTIATPWVICMMKRWETKHTVVNGRRLAFDGTGGQLIGKWIVWILLCIVTVMIFSLWLPIKVKKWQVKHISFAA